jgi:hypothetical protein
MKLIAIFGVTLAKSTNEYFIDNIPYRRKVSFFILKEHFNIKDEKLIIGTNKIKDRQKEYTENFNFVEVNADDFDNVFAKAIKTFENNAILDLTQAFKSIDI